MEGVVMEDEVLADEIILRLNRLIKDPDIRKDLASLIETRVFCSKTTADHPGIQVDEDLAVGFLGMLNGIVGVDPKLVGPRRGWGYIAADYDDDTLELVGFKRVVNAKQAQT
jgi:hypothetical protein